MEPDLPPRLRYGDAATGRRSRSRERGQGLIMFVGGLVFLIGLLAVVVDVTWYWAKTLEVQRAADAAALAGAVWLPEQPAKAVTVALASATQNGYTTGSGVTVTAAQDPARDIQLDTSVSAPVSTFFMRLFGINTIRATRTAAAEYVLPVPMGSPLNYFGAFGALRGGWIHMDTAWLYPTATRVANGVVDTWSQPANAFVDESPALAQNATTPNTTDVQGFTRFRIPGYPSIANFGMPAAASARFQSDGGIEVVVKASSSVMGCKLQAEVSSNSDLGATATWAGAPNVATGNPATLTTTPTEYTFGGPIASAANDATDWWRTSGWTTTDFADAHFAVRLKAVGSGSCSSATTSVDYIKVRVSYEQQEPLITGPHGEPLGLQGIWATVNSQGSGAINGDIYSSAGLNTDGSGTNSAYAPGPYYDYAVEMEPGTSNGSVYVFDPVFCATNSDGSQGMGDRWFGSGPMSTFYDLYDTNNTPYDLTDDTWIAGNTGPAGASNPQYNLFRRSNASDSSQGGSGGTNCQRGGANNDPSKGAYWHNRWWTLATGLAGPTGATPRVYRIRVTSTDLAAPTDQSGTNAQNSFSLFASVSGHTCPTSPADALCPRVYGLGTMEAFSPLDPNTSVDLYMSQIGKVYAGKTIKVSLWDPGDTGALSAVLTFRMPTSTGYQDAPFTWSASRFVPAGSNCNGTSTGTVTSITTNTGNNSKFNGCWVIISIAIPIGYTAPTPPGEPGPGWWKIRYTMGNQSSASAFDVTTWKTQIIGNPVHLVVP